MGKMNLAVNRLLERKDVFADLINGTVFDGKQILRPEKMELISQHSGVIERRKGRLGAVEREGDIRMKAAIGTYSVLFANETQEKVHYAMPVRNMLYDALEYTKQIQDIEKQHKQEGIKLDEQDFLSGITKEDRLKPVITTVLFLGDEWDGAENLHELLEIDELDESVEEVKKYIPDYHINLVNVADIKEPSKFKTCLQTIFNMLKYRKDKYGLKHYINNHETEIEQMDTVEKTAALMMLGGQKKVETWLCNRKESEEWHMGNALEELIQDGIEEGREKGRKEGMKEGKEEGIREGEAKAITLFKCLMRDKRTDLMSKVTEDFSLREKLYQQYGI